MGTIESVLTLTGDPLEQAGRLAWNPDDGMLYASCVQTFGLQRLWKIDPATGLTTLIADTGHNRIPLHANGSQPSPSSLDELPKWNFLSFTHLSFQYDSTWTAMIMSKILLFLSFLLAATTVDADTIQYATDNGAIDGYDTVAYFTNGRPERGSPDITAEWNGVEWRFASQENRDAFIKDPKQYAPEYGGFCALGMAHGGDVPTDPEAWTIWNGKLYLNMIDEVRTTWLYNPDKLTERADRQWQAMNKVEQ